jgi:SAM-dependent methyltransferase
MRPINVSVTLCPLSHPSHTPSTDCLKSLERGGGSVAAWLCERVGPSGHVLATDLEPRFLEALGHPNLTVRRHNIVTDDLPAAAFDLIHSRMVLEHLPERAVALRRLVAALKPGGWLAFEDIDEGSIALLSPTDAASVASFAKGQEARKRVMRGRGHIADYGRQLPTLFREAGLVEIDAEGQVPVFLPGPRAQFARLTVEQLRDEMIATGMVDAGDIAAYLGVLECPDFAMLGPTLFAVRGRRPLAT